MLQSILQLMIERQQQQIYVGLKICLTRNDANEQFTEEKYTTNKTSPTSCPTEVVGNKRKRQKKIDKGLKGDNVIKILGKVIELQEASDKMEEKSIKLDV